MQIELRVMDLLISRLCHDLISPAGAIVNGIELVEEFGEDDMADEDMTGEAMSLVGRSARQLSAKLSLFRVAFGSGDLFNPCKVLPTGRGCGAGHDAEIRRFIATPGVYA